MRRRAPGDSGVELDPEADGIEDASRGMLDRRSDTRRVRYLVRSGNVARADDHGKAQPELPAVVSDGLLVFDLDGDRGAGRNVGDRGREDIGPLFLDETRPLALVLRLLVLRLGRCALPDDTLDRAITDLHPQMIDRSVLGQGEDVNALRPLAAGVDELLTDTCPSDDSGHDHVDVRLEHGRGHERFFRARPPEHCAFGDAPGPRAGVTSALRPGGVDRQDGDEAHDHQSREAPRGTAHRLDHRSPAGDVESACARSVALVPATARVLGAATASLRNSRWTRRLSSWHSWPGSSQSDPSCPSVTSLIEVSGTPSSTRNCLTACARRSARTRLYSAGP